MAGPRRGIYEALLTEALEVQLRDVVEPHLSQTGDLRAAEAADRIALHLSRVILRSLGLVPDKDRVAVGIRLARQLVQKVEELIERSDAGGDRPVEPGRLLNAIVRRLPDGEPEEIRQPLIPLLDTTLLTNSPGEPRVGHQIVEEIPSADRVDVVMAFVRRSGIRPLSDALGRHCRDGKLLRVLTTTFTGSTELAALEDLNAMGARVRVSYDTSSTRLHAKAWLFHRESGYSTAYIGSSNLSHAAQVAGLEWNVRVSGARNPDVIAKVEAVFNAYWDGGDFVDFRADEFQERVQQERAPTLKVLLSPVQIRLEPFQERLLEQIALSRERGLHRNLLASATGTGKTVMAAVDYARLRGSLPRARLLFVAHRREILEQSLATFRQALRDPAFGELWVGGERPSRFEHVFASIQSLNARGLESMDPSHFDVVIVDEFHHAAAPSYEALLTRMKPAELLGLTATPERSDGLPILDLFGGRIAAELRLWDAVDQHRLSPFEYYGVHDGVDLREVPWKRGHGYVAESLTNLLTGNERWVHLVLAQLSRRTGSLGNMRCLGFCVSIEHARFMARKFQEAGVPSAAVWADTPDEERAKALKDLEARRINVLFSVDLFNEGVDLPTVDTLLMLRPTDSPTLFLQQLGRGLRLAQGKSTCLVLDFVGHHRKEFRFDRRFRALLGGSRDDLRKQVESGFPFLPAGCHMELDHIASTIVLQSIRESVPSGWKAKVEELRRLAASGGEVGLVRFLADSGLDLEDVYSSDRSWSDLREDAGLRVLPAGPQETRLRNACGRLLHVDDPVRIQGWLGMLGEARAPDPASLGVRDQRLLRMLVASMVDKAEGVSESLGEAADFLWSHPQVCAELREVLAVREGSIDHLQADLPDHPDVPLRVHARYTRIEILAAFGVGKKARTQSWREGVHWAKESGVDILAFTLDKTSGAFSPTTRYEDYAISRELVHWQSQSGTRTDSPTGRRYRGEGKSQSVPMLFCRLRADDRSFHFLGPASFVSHEGERPMSIIWRLRHSLPGDLYQSFAAVVA